MKRFAITLAAAALVAGSIGPGHASDPCPRPAQRADGTCTNPADKVPSTLTNAVPAPRQNLPGGSPASNAASVAASQPTTPAPSVPAVAPAPAPSVPTNMASNLAGSVASQAASRAARLRMLKTMTMGQGVTTSHSPMFLQKSISMPIPSTGAEIVPRARRGY